MDPRIEDLRSVIRAQDETIKRLTAQRDEYHAQLREHFERGLRALRDDLGPSGTHDDLRRAVLALTEDEDVEPWDVPAAAAAAPERWPTWLRIAERVYGLQAAIENGYRYLPEGE